MVGGGERGEPVVSKIGSGVARVGAAWVGVRGVCGGVCGGACCPSPSLSKK